MKIDIDNGYRPQMTKLSEVENFMELLKSNCGWFCELVS